jgi:hypothetical protein
MTPSDAFVTSRPILKSVGATGAYFPPVALHVAFASTAFSNVRRATSGGASPSSPPAGRNWKSIGSPSLPRRAVRVTISPASAVTNSRRVSVSPLETGASSEPSCSSGLTVTETFTVVLPVFLIISVPPGYSGLSLSVPNGRRPVQPAIDAPPIIALTVPRYCLLRTFLCIQSVQKCLRLY